MKKLFTLLFLSALIIPLSAYAEDADTGSAVSDTNVCVQLTRQLGLGSRDANTNGEVSQLQQFLHDHDYLSINATGYYGIKTAQAVRQFQIDQNLIPASSTSFFKVGNLTRQAVASVSCGSTGVTASTNNQNNSNNSSVHTNTQQNLTQGVYSDSELDVRRKAVSAYYEQYLQREPEEAGLNYWVNSNLTLDQIKSGILASNEYILKQQIIALYPHIFSKNISAKELNDLYSRPNDWNNIVKLSNFIDQINNQLKNIKTIPKVISQDVTYSSTYPATVTRGQRMFGSAKVSASPNSPVLFFLQRPDGTLKYNGQVVGTTNSDGIFSYSDATNDSAGSSQGQLISLQGQNGTWVSWVNVNGVKSNVLKTTVLSDTATSNQPFTITFPTAGATLQAGQTYNITWMGSDPGVSNYSVYLVGGKLGSTGSLYLGAAYPRADGTGGTFSWTVPADMYSASNYQIQFSGRWVTGGNSSSFTIVSPTASATQPSITVLSPNGGESWQAGSSQIVRWNSSGVNKVSIWLCQNNICSRFAEIPATGIVNNNSYTVVIPSSASGSSKIRVASEDNYPTSTLYDDSDSTFAINTSTITSSTSVTLTASASSITTGSIVNFSWQSVPGTASYKFYLSCPPGVNASATDGNACNSFQTISPTVQGYSTKLNNLNSFDSNVAATIYAYDANNSILGQQSTSVKVLAAASANLAIALSSTNAQAGTVITVTSQNPGGFSTKQNNVIQFGNSTGSNQWSVVSTDGNHLTFTVPSVSAGTYNVSVWNMESGLTSATVPFTLNAPSIPVDVSVVKTAIASISPASATAGQTVTLTGTGFSKIANDNTIYLTATTGTTGTQTFPATSADGSTLAFTVPANAYGNFSVSVWNLENGQTSNSVQFTLAAATTPQISSLSPSSGPAGTSVTITGSGFATSNDNVIYFTNSAGSVSSTMRSTDGIHLTFTVGNYAYGIYGVSVWALDSGKTSNTVNFTLTQPAQILTTTSASNTSGTTVSPSISVAYPVNSYSVGSLVPISWTSTNVTRVKIEACWNANSTCYTLNPLFTVSSGSSSFNWQTKTGDPYVGAKDMRIKISDLDSAVSAWNPNPISIVALTSMNNNAQQLASIIASIQNIINELKLLK